MLGAVTGDIIGSRFEFHGTKNTEFDLLSRGCRYTDDCSTLWKRLNSWPRSQPASPTTIPKASKAHKRYCGGHFHGSQRSLQGNDKILYLE